MKTKYPIKIEKIIAAAPIWYSIVMLMDYNSKSKSVNDLYKKWLIDKINIKNNESN